MAVNIEAAGGSTEPYDRFDEMDSIRGKSADFQIDNPSDSVLGRKKGEEKAARPVIERVVGPDLDPISPNGPTVLRLGTGQSVDLGLILSISGPDGGAIGKRTREVFVRIDDAVTHRPPTSGSARGTGI